MKTRENERRDSGIIIILILLLGFICIILASGWALRFAPSWKLDTNMGSNLDPSSGFLTSQPVGLFEPIDPAILTNPVWIDGFLTPGISFQTRTPLPTNTATFVPTNTNTPIPTFTTVPTNTLVIVVIPPATKTPKPPPPPPPPSTNTNTPVAPPPSADLQITKTDNATDYEAGGSTTYTIVVSNNGPSNVVGAVVTDNIPVQISSWTWVCTSQNGGATGCDAIAGSNTNFTDSVDLPNGASIVYTVTANIFPGATGTLANTANINVPVGITDPNSGNDSAADTPSDTLIVASCFPYGNIDTTPDGSATTIIAPSFVTLQFCPSGIPTPLIVGGDASYDLVYHPDPNPAPSIQIGAILLWIGDGQNWYPVFYWGGGGIDSNTNVAGSLSSPPNSTDCTSEPDNCVMDPLLLYNSTGIAIDVDAVIPPSAYGNFPYIRIISPSAPDVDGGVSVDAIEVLP